MPWRRTGRSERNAGQAAEQATGTLDDRNTGLAPEQATGTLDDRNTDPTPERNTTEGDRLDRSDTVVPVSHEVTVPEPGGTGALVMRSRAGEVAERAAEGLRFVNLANLSLREVLRYARQANYNLGHIPAVRAFCEAFFFCVTAPVLALGRFAEWVHLRPHRAVVTHTIVLTAAHFLNRLVDWLVPDWLDAATWPATMWQVIAGAAGVLLVATLIIYRRDRW
jgi:hypothetical protein